MFIEGRHCLLALLPGMPAHVSKALSLPNFKVSNSMPLKRMQAFQAIVLINNGFLQ